MNTSDRTQSSRVLSSIRESNIVNYVNIMSDEDVLTTLLGRSTTTTKKEENIKKLLNENSETKQTVLNAVSDVLQSITTECMTISELLEHLYKNYSDDVINALGDFIKIVHAPQNVIIQNGNNTGRDEVLFENTPFAIPFDNALPVKTGNKYKHSSTYGLVSSEVIQSIYKNKNNEKNLESDGINALYEKMGNLLRKTNDASQNDISSGVIFSADGIINNKIIGTKPPRGDRGKGLEVQFANAKYTKDDSIPSNSFEGRVKATKSDTSFAFIMMDSADLRIGTRNSLELATFFNTLSTIELSKCQPYFNAVFILPGEVKNSSGKVFKTASITQFFNGTPISEGFTSDVYKTLEASFVRTQNTRDGVLESNAVNTNLSAFTMPQTINNFDEIFVGHNENVQPYKNKNFRRSTSIHDYTRPFMTIKSFDIDVAPTQGLMSFKTGKLSLILHDRTRMTDIAPFIKPDLFGSFGAEIAVEYGWSHIDGGGNINYLGDFLNNSRVVEKYIITNSSFSMDNNGQVNIDLSIAMRGPLDVKQIVIKSSPPVEASKDKAMTSLNSLNQSLASFENFSLERFISTFHDEIGAINTASITEASLTACNNLVKNKLIKGKNRKELENQIKNIKEVKKLKEFIISLSQNKKGKYYIRNPIVTEGLDGVLLDEITDALKVNLVDAIINIKSIVNVKAGNASKANTLVHEIIGGLDKIDPFYNKEWLNQWLKIVVGKKDVENTGTTISGIGKSKLGGTSYVSFGAFITGLIGTHMTCTGKFNEIQVVSYTANEFCGLMSNLNIASFLLPRLDLEIFLKDLFKAGTSMTLESIIKQVIERFISTRLQICYGLSEFYERDAAKNTIINKKRSGNTKILQENINKKLFEIYTNLAVDKSTDASKGQEITGYEDIKFIMPKIKFTFDTMTSKKSSFQKTICRISIFDQNDNPFGSVHTIMKKVYDEDGVVAVSAKLNKLRAEYKAGSKNKNQQKVTKERFYKKQNEILDRLEREGKLVKIDDSGLYKIVDTFQLDTIKNSIKNIMPSITYGTQNSAIIDASVTTVNESKLNTVYLTRSDRNNRKKQLETKVEFQKDLPLRVLPSQSTVTTWGCPFINFAQYIFLDFETGTTIDNAYAVTGIKHSMTPGKFTTSITLSYGDVYGKYENAAKTIARELDDRKKHDNKTKEEKKAENKTKPNDATEPDSSNSSKDSKVKITKKSVIDFTKKMIVPESVLNLDASIRPTLSFDLGGITYNINTNFLIYNRNIICVKTNDSDTTVNINFFHFLDFDKDFNKDIHVNLDISSFVKNSKVINNKFFNEQYENYISNKIINRRRSSFYNITRKSKLFNSKKIKESNEAIKWYKDDKALKDFFINIINTNKLSYSYKINYIDNKKSDLQKAASKCKASIKINKSNDFIELFNKEFKKAINKDFLKEFIYTEKFDISSIELLEKSIKINYSSKKRSINQTFEIFYTSLYALNYFTLERKMKENIEKNLVR